MGTSEPDAGVDGEQLALVGLCLLGLVVAAFLAPVATPVGAECSDQGGGASGQLQCRGSGAETGQGKAGSGSGQQGPGTQTGQGAGTPSDSRVTATGEGAAGGEGTDDGGAQGEPDGGVLGDGAPVPIPGGTAPPTDGCGVVIYERPVPGDNLTVSVYQDLDPATNTSVWFNDDYVGRTDSEGNITARVPYERRLNVTVEHPSNDPCEFYRYPYEGEATPTDDAVGAVAPGSERLGSSGQRQYAVRAPAPPVRGPMQQTTPSGENSTGEYGVYGDVTVRIEGQPYPGSTVTVNATIEGVPMRQANVTLDGQRVGRTDDSGEYALTVPDREVAAVTVARGAFNGSARIDVLQLDVRFATADPFIVPGEAVAVNATREGTPVENATVTLDGARLGTTDAAGRVRFGAPPTLAGTVTASTARQTATVSVLSVYMGTITATLLLAVGAALTTAAAARGGGRSGAKRVGAGWAVVGALFVAFAVGEWLGLAGVASVVALALLYRYRAVVRSGGAATAGLLAGLADALRRAALAVTGLLEVVADWAVAALSGLSTWLGSLPRSVGALARRLGAWLRSLPRRSLALLRGLPVKWIGVAALALAVVAGARAVAGSRGFLVAVAVVALVTMVALYRRRSGSTSDADPELGTTIDDQPTAIGAEVDATPSLRELWRRLARWVLPSRWRTSTPTEISRAALERGLPREPVERLADAFRDVEYGGQAATGYRETVRTAFEAITEAREGDER